MQYNTLISTMKATYPQSLPPYCVSPIDQCLWLVLVIYEIANLMKVQFKLSKNI